MNILLTGGSRVMVEGLIAEMLGRGHRVQLHGAASKCDAIVHLSLRGTENAIDDAKRAGAERFVFVSSLGADAREGEQAVMQSGLLWTIVRAATVYGPSDEVVSELLTMVRTLPAIPMHDGDREFQPIWYRDLGKIVAGVIEHRELAGQIVDAAGPEITTINDLLGRFEQITGRSPLRVPVPAALASVNVPHETIFVRGENAAGILGISMTPLDHALRLLADAMPEQTPDEGVGALHHNRFWADITGSRFSPVALMKYFREHVNEFMPVEFSAEPGTPKRIEEGLTLTGTLPLRGHFQVRVEVAEPTRVVFATLEGHPLAGVVEFTTSETPRGIRFAVDTCTRAANAFDWLALKTLGEAAQGANWRIVVQRAIDASGGTSDGVQMEKRTLSESEAAVVEKSVREMVATRKLEELVDGRQ